MKIIQNTERETVAMLVVVQNLGVRRIIPTSENVMVKKRETWKISWEKEERM